MQGIFEVKMDLLVRAANAFIELKKVKYRIVLSAGRNKPIEEILINFCDTDLYHMLGFQYLSDIALPRSKKRILPEIIKGTISEGTISKSKFYDNDQLGHNIKNRIEKVAYIEQFLDSDNYNVFIFKDQHNICTKIKSDYLIVCREISSGNEYYIFIRRRKGEDGYNIVSCFPKEKISYWGGKRYLMLKEKIINGVPNQLFKHPNYEEN